MRVLLATDGSDAAKTAAQWLDHLPLPADREVMAIAVVNTPPIAPEIVGEFRATLVAEARHLADDTAAKCLRPGGTTTGRVVEGDPRAEIVAAAKDWGADLIVLGARGLGAMRELLLGSVSLGVAREAPCPVLVCKGTPRDVRSVGVTLDGSDHARRALAWLLALPLAPDTRLRLVSVAEPQRYPSSAPGILGETLRRETAALEAERCAALDKECAVASERARAHNLAVDVAVRTGSPADVIVHESEQSRSDLLVMGAR